MAETVATLAVDIGTMTVKAMASVAGSSGTRSTIFPTRVATGERALTEADKAPLSAQVRGALVRVGDVSSREGYSAFEFPSALNAEESLGALLSAVAAHFDIDAVEVLMLSSTPDIFDLSAIDVRLAVSCASLREGGSLRVGRLGLLDAGRALLADASINLFGTIAEASGKTRGEGVLAVLDCGSKAVRLTAFSASRGTGSGAITTQELSTECAFEKRAVEVVEERHRVSVTGTLEMLERASISLRGKSVSVELLIEQARQEVRDWIAPALAETLLASGCKSLYVGGGNAMLFGGAIPPSLNIKTRVAKQSEMRIVHGLLKSGRRWGSRQ